MVSAAVLTGAFAGAAAAAVDLELPGLLVASGPHVTPSPTLPVKVFVEVDDQTRPLATSTPSAPPPSATPTKSRSESPKPPKNPEKTASPEPSETPEPEEPRPVEPTKFVMTTFGTTVHDGKPGHQVRTVVPKGWEAVKTDLWRRDFRDPTREVLLRVWGVNGFGAPTNDGNAEAELAKRKTLKDFETWGITHGYWLVAKDKREIWYDQFTYSWTEDGEVKWAVEWYPYSQSYNGGEREDYPGMVMVGAVAGSLAQLDLLETAMGKVIESYTDYPVEM